MPDTLEAGQSLKSNGTTRDEKQIYSDFIDGNILSTIGIQNKDYCAALMQEDGNFVVYFVVGHGGGSSDEGHAKWDTKTQGHGTGPYEITMQSDGHLDLTDVHGTRLWRSPSKPASKEPCRLVMQIDCNLVIRDANGQSLWDSGTAGKLD